MNIITPFYFARILPPSLITQC